MSSSERKWVRIRKIFLNKYLVVLTIFAVFITFFGEYNLIRRWQTRQKIKEQEKELKFYQDEIIATKQKKNQLQSSDENLEKFAREHYFMKNKDEDIYIIKE